LVFFSFAFSSKIFSREEPISYYRLHDPIYSIRDSLHMWRERRRLPSLMYSLHQMR
jgi:hypothetical protein